MARGSAEGLVTVVVAVSDRAKAVDLGPVRAAMVAAEFSRLVAV